MLRLRGRDGSGNVIKFDLEDIEQISLNGPGDSFLYIDPCKALLGEISILKGHIKLLRGIWQEVEDAVDSDKDPEDEMEAKL